MDWTPLIVGQADLIADVRSRTTRYVVSARCQCRQCSAELAQFVYFMDANEEPIERGVIVWRPFNMTKNAAVMIEMTPGQGDYVQFHLNAASHPQPTSARPLDRAMFAGWAVVTEHLTGHKFAVRCGCDRGVASTVTAAEMHASTTGNRTVRK